MMGGYTPQTPRMGSLFRQSVHAIRDDMAHATEDGNGATITHWEAHGILLHCFHLRRTEALRSNRER